MDVGVLHVVVDDNDDDDGVEDVTVVGIGVGFVVGGGVGVGVGVVVVVGGVVIVVAVAVVAGNAWGFWLKESKKDDVSASISEVASAVVDSNSRILSNSDSEVWNVSRR